MGVIILSEPNNIVFMNNAAGQILRRHDGLCGVGGQLNAINPEDNRALQSNLKQMFQGTIVNGVDFSEPLSINRNTQSFPYRILLTPLIRKALAVHDSDSLVLAMVHDPDQPLEESFKTVQAAHGLTKRETLLASYLCRGFDLDKMAEETNTSINTVRTHMKSVLRKTGTNSQAQLVAKIYSSFGLTSPIFP